MYNVLGGVGGTGSLIWASKNDFQNRSTAPSQGADQTSPQHLPSLSNTDRQKGQTCFGPWGQAKGLKNPQEAKWQQDEHIDLLADNLGIFIEDSAEGLQKVNCQSKQWCVEGLPWDGRSTGVSKQVSANAFWQIQIDYFSVCELLSNLERVYSETISLVNRVLWENQIYQ